MTVPITYSFVTWCSDSCIHTQQELIMPCFVKPHFNHWSRKFEYSFAAVFGDFHPGQWVLDAAGGDGVFQRYLSHGGCQVINVDLDSSRQLRPLRGILNVTGDLKKLGNFHDNVFDRISCLSVLEHITEPLQAVEQLWRVLRVNGRLVVTLDVTDYARYNHTCSTEVASSILDFFGLSLPKFPEGGMSVTWPEHSDGLPGNETVTIKVLCFAVTKG